MTVRSLTIYASVGIFLLLLLTGVYLWWPEEEMVPPSVVEEPTAIVSEQIVGHSVENRPIVAYTYGSGPTDLLFVGGIHGGYEWNSSILAYEMMAHIEADPSVVPEDLTVTIVPALNPDGLFEVVGKEGRLTLADAPATHDASGTGRMNQNGIDLNRNFACKWAATSTWRGAEVSAGANAFSEPEAAAIRDLVLELKPEAVVFWHSQGGAVYASECHDGILPVTLDIMNLYASAAEYQAIPVFDAYPITGDAEGWLASIGIPALTVELSTHTGLDWAKNLAGTLALFDYFAVAK